MAREEEKKNQKTKRPQAEKRAIQSEKRRLRNRSFRALVRTAIRHLDETVAKGDAQEAQKSLAAAYSLMDKGVKKKVFKPNKASRTKARLAARLVAKA